MIIPVRCFNCGQILGSKYKKYMELLNEPLLIEKNDGTRVYFVASSFLKKNGESWDKKNEIHLLDRQSRIQEIMAYVESTVTQKGSDSEKKSQVIPRANNIEAILLNQLGLTRYCCRSHMISHIQLLDKL
jgi:DNA-directed RNA polymerase subunit N (RpoN/RPB10)